MPHAIDRQVRRVRDRGDGIATAIRQDERIIAAVNDECRRRDPRQTRAAIAGHRHCRDLAGRAARHMAASKLIQQKATMRRLVECEAGSGEAAREGEALGQETFLVHDRIGHRAHQHRHDVRRGLRKRGIARARHDRGERQDPLGMLARHRLRDHAAHRAADDVRPLDGKRIQQADRVGSHVVERVGHVRPPPGHERCGESAEIRHRPGGEMRRAAGVAIIEADHAIAAYRQFLAERHRPADHLCPQPGNQEDRLVGFIAEAFPGEFDSVGVRDVHDEISSGSIGDVVRKEG